ncbi:MAG: hypothetical protein K0Q79_2695 [Flavipsychrobacter sp.]|jgi:hypothetical protein|nr:hypothetical protein [Flavipsychrobacter sp.]
MKKTTITAWLMLICFTSFGQQLDVDLQQVSASIVAEAKKLYNSEMASWYGTDIFLEKCPNKDVVDGYFSYNDGNVIKNIFFSKGLHPKVVFSSTFDSTFNVKNARVDLNERAFTKLEEDYFIIRERAFLAMKEDTMFQFYKNTNPNLVPLITGNEKKVYVLTGPKESGVVIFGNDYLLTFDKDNNLVNKERLHNSMLSTNFKGADSTQVGGIHSHVIPGRGDFITATDICTLMLYGKYTKWKQYVVVSAKYFSFWNCETNQLFILTTEDAKAHFEQKKKTD